LEAEAAGLQLLVAEVFTVVVEEAKRQGQEEHPRTQAAVEEAVILLRLAR